MSMTTMRGFSAGDWIEVRPVGEVLETLDEHGCLDALPFMLEMTRYCGQRFQVVTAALNPRYPGSGSDGRRMAGAVNLGTGCDGSAHDGCRGGCTLFWKPDWLTPVDAPGAAVAAPSPPEEAEIERLRVATRYVAGNDGQTRNRCQVWDTVPAATMPRPSLAATVWRLAAGNGGMRSANPWVQLLPDTASVASDAYSIEVASDPAAVAEQWEALEPAAATAFQTRAWLLPLYRIVGEASGAAPVFVTVRSRETGRAVMFLPLCIWRKAGVRVIEFADFGVTDYNLPIGAPGFMPGAAEMRAIWMEIRRRLPPADIIRFTKVPETTAGRPVPLVQLDWLSRMELRSWTVELPRTRAEYDTVVLKPKDRKEQRRKRRHLEDQLGSTSLVAASNKAEAREIFQALAEHRRGRFAALGRREILAEPAFRRFYEAVAFDGPGGIAALAALKAGDRTVASLFGVTHNGNFLLLMHSFGAGLERLSPGIVALNETISLSIKSGDRYFDFTTGNESYKRQFGVRAGVLYEGIYPLSAKGRVLVKALAAVKLTASPRMAMLHRAVQTCETAIKAWLRRAEGTAATPEG
jgi:CelD/BcsL family acetyltransferase involved in cellulose biosynthesis